MITNPNIRKAAVLLRSLDAETTALMLGQLSAAEAGAVRAALLELGPVEQEEQADVLAEFRSVRPTMGANANQAIELSLSSVAAKHADKANVGTVESQSPRRFEFLVGASTTAVVAMLAREHAQTVAVVLAHLAPERAAAILAALPEKLQADTIERLSVLSETDPESVTVIERELAIWLATRTENRDTLARRRETVTKILAAADPKTRRSLQSTLKLGGTMLTEQPAPSKRDDKPRSTPRIPQFRSPPTPAGSFDFASARQSFSPETMAGASQAPPTPRTPQPRFEFDQLIHFDTAALSAVLREVDANVLALALAGSRDELVERITSQMPKRIARIFRRELRKLGPTKLSDVEGAQHIVADAAARYLVRRHRPLASVAP